MATPIPKYNKAALAELETAADKAAGSELYTMIKDTVQARYPYC